MPRAQARKKRQARAIKNVLTAALKQASRAAIDPTTGVRVGAATAGLQSGSEMLSGLGIGAQAAPEAAAQGGNWLNKLWGKGNAALKSPAGKSAMTGALGFMLLDMLMNSAQSLSQASLQKQSVNSQMASLSPEAAAEQALQPITKAQREHALMMLLRQMGADTGPMLAEGEVYT